ncbi:AMIN domain-containing protein [Microcoleus sp. A006_D1]|uniref:AMIN domain-containing protein n=1 Tax=Microcoleus sp. A006_D1 TaxID=3055267 RepID=UPI002FD5E77B
MKQHLRLSGGLLCSVAGVLIVQAPVWAAPTQVTGVQVSQGNNGVNIVLATEKGDRPQVIAINTGNTYQATIINTQLRLPQGNSFRQDNPAPGISSVQVSQVDGNSIRVVVAGTNGVPNGQVVPGQGQSIVLSVAGQGGTVQSAQVASAPPPPPGLPLSPSTPRPAPQIRTSQTPGVMLPNPEVTVTRNDRPPLPSEIQSQNNQAAPFQPRAVAPPLGDIAVSNIAPAGANIELSSGERIPRLVLRDAPVRDVLALLARAAGLNIAFTGGGAPGQPGQPAAAPGAAGGSDEGPKISLDIENESVQDVFNYVLRISGLQANRVGRTIFVGTNLPLDSRNIIVRTLRLNQVRSTDAANFLSAQGAETQLPITRVTIQTVGQGNTARDVEIREPDIKVIGARDGNGPLLLRGLSVLADARLNSITLVGDPRKVDIAVAFLSQLDLRRRQVAVNVKVIDVNLLGNNRTNSSFSFGINNNFFVNDNGVASLNFGGLQPPTVTDINNGSRLGRPLVPNPIGTQQPFYDPRGNLINVPLTGQGGGLFVQPTAPITNDPTRVGISDYTPFNPATVNSVGSATFALFPLFQYPRRLLSALQATIESRNAKILTDPTLVVQEGETANVNITDEVITNITSQTQTTGNTSTTTVTAVKDKAGLQLGVAIDRVDDNGFVSLRVNPIIRTPGGTQDLITGGNSTNQIRLLGERSLQSGLIRLRDGQTLIVSGIIRDEERVTANKIPILGDLPIIGSLFRSTNKTNERAELIVLLTPQILDDSDRSNFGYQNSISPDARQLLQRSQPVQPRQ